MAVRPFASSGTRIAGCGSRSIYCILKGSCWAFSIWKASDSTSRNNSSENQRSVLCNEQGSPSGILEVFFHRLDMDDVHSSKLFIKVIYSTSDPLRVARSNEVVSELGVLIQDGACRMYLDS